MINITSVGGKYGAPFMGAYAASKHAVEGLSDSLRRELMLYGIDVIVVGAQLHARPMHSISGEVRNVPPAVVHTLPYNPVHGASMLQSTVCSGATH